MSLFAEFKGKLEFFIRDTYEKNFKAIMSKRRSEDVCELMGMIARATHPILLKGEILNRMGTMYEQTAFLVRVAFKLGIDSSKLHKGLKQILDDKRFNDKNLELDFAVETRALAVQTVENSEIYKELQAKHEKLSNTIEDFIEKLKKAEARVKELEEKNEAQAKRIKELETNVTSSPEHHVTVEVNTRVEDKNKIQDLELEMKEIKIKNCSLTHANQQLTQKNSELVLEKNKLKDEVVKKDEEIEQLKGSNQQLLNKNLTYLKGTQDKKNQPNAWQAEVNNTNTMPTSMANKPSFWSRVFGSSNKQTAEPSKTYFANSNICFIE